MKAANPPERKLTLLGICFSLVFKLMLWILAAWCIAVLIAIGLLIHWQAEQAIIYWQHLLNFELKELSQHSETLLMHRPVVFATQTLQHLENSLLGKMHGLELIQQAKSYSFKTNIARIDLLLQKAGSFLSLVIRLILLVTELTMLRLLVIGLFFPLVAIAGFLGLIDGLIQRELRRAGGGRESALLYHRARSCIMAFLFWGSFLYIVLPFHLKPDFILLPFTILFGLVVAITASAFKKYI